MAAFLALGVSAVLIAVDQLIKWWAVACLQPVGTIPIIPNVLHLTYVENTGAAFGLFGGATLWLAVLTGVVLIAIVYLIVSKRLKSSYLVWTMSLIFAGGAGNLIDRLLRGFVVDMVDFRLINFYVFNFADCCVVMGVILLGIYIFFGEKIDARLNQRKNKQEPPSEGAADGQP